MSSSSLSSSLERNFLLAFGFLTLISLAQGSCWRYGHSCWGGHGKRSGGGGGEEERRGHVDRKYPILPYTIPNRVPPIRLGDSYEIERGGTEEDVRISNSEIQDDEEEGFGGIEQEEVKIPIISGGTDEVLELDLGGESKDAGGSGQWQRGLEQRTTRKGRRRTAVLIYGVLTRRR